MDYQLLADLLYPQITTMPEDMEQRYPPRNLPEGAKVTRFAPSPTGFLHIGNLPFLFLQNGILFTEPCLIG